MQEKVWFTTSIYWRSGRLFLHDRRGTSIARKLNRTTNKMIVNIINSYRDTVAIADKELVGKKFLEGSKQLDVKKSFYKGEEGKETTPNEIREIISNWVKEDATFNIVGEKSISMAIEMGLIDRESIGTIDNIPYALILL